MAAGVRTGRAVGVMSPFLVSEELQKGTLVSLSIGSHPLVRQWGLAHRGQRTLGPMDKRMIELCRQAVPGIMSRLQGATVPLAESSGEQYEKAASALLGRRLDLSKVGLILVSLQNMLMESFQRTDLTSLCLSVLATALNFAQVFADFPRRQ